MGTLRKMGAFLGLVPDDHQRYDHEVDAHHDGGYHPSGYDDHPDTPSDATSFDQASFDGAGYDGAGDDGADHDGSSYGGAEYAGTLGAPSSGSSPYRADDDSDPRYDDAAPSYAYGGGADRHDPEDSERGDRSERTGAQGAVRRPAFAGAGRSRRSERAEASSSDYSTQGALAVQPEARIEAVSISEPATSQKPATVSLTGFADAREVGEFYRNGQAVILDMTDLTDAEARRMVDFAAGLAFAVRGSIDKVTTKVFMLHPPADADR